MIFETVKSEGLSHFSYVIGDQDTGTCAVIDPRRDIDVYLEIARAHQAQITYILETHIHADFLSGSRELAARTGARIGVGATGSYGFEHMDLAEGDRLELGQLVLDVLHTPGHTPEHICFLVSGGNGAPAAWGVFTGDTLFAGEVGRPDLLGDGTEQQLAAQLHRSLHDKLLPLGDDIVIYPAHGEGSPCGASIGDRPTSTIGYERRHNPVLQIPDQATFARRILESQSPAPRYYPHMKKINAEGPRVLGTLPYLKPLTPHAFRRAMDQPGTVVIDTREITAFGGAHVVNAINIGLRAALPIWMGWVLGETFPIWAGWMVEPDQRILLVVSDEAEVDVVLRHLLRIGYENVEGYLRQGMRGWIEAGLPFVRMPQMSVHELKERIEKRDHVQVLDVRGDGEWDQGHIPTARHIFVSYLEQNLEQLDRQRPVAVYCGSGYRASIAASILQQHDFREVYNIPGSMSAWQAADYPLEQP